MTFRMGSRMKAQNERVRGLPSESFSLVVHLEPFWSNLHSPQSLGTRASDSILNLGAQILAKVSSVKAHCC